MKAIPWGEAKRRAEETRHAAGHPVRSDAERAAGQRRLDDEIRAWLLAENTAQPANDHVYLNLKSAEMPARARTTTLAHAATGSRRCWRPCGK